VWAGAVSVVAKTNFTATDVKAAKEWVIFAMPEVGYPREQCTAEFTAILN
jgi:hypothetical protein